MLVTFSSTCNSSDPQANLISKYLNSNHLITAVTQFLTTLPENAELNKTRTSNRSNTELAELPCNVAEGYSTVQDKHECTLPRIRRSNQTPGVAEYEGALLPVVSMAMKYASKKLVQSGFADSFPMNDL